MDYGLAVDILFQQARKGQAFRLERPSTEPPVTT